MYKIMIVDDEDDARCAIAAAVNWEQEGFLFPIEAKNGREALELMAGSPPDVVIADINMPYVNGLELLKVSGEEYPLIKVILLSAYDDFEYAQSAVRCQAFDYILKPVTKQELLEVLRSVKCSMDRESADREDIEKLRREYEASLPILREKFLSVLLTSDMQIPEAEKKALRYGLDFSGKTIVTGVITFDADPDGRGGELDREMGGELAKFAVYNIAGEVMQNHGAGMAFMHEQNIVLIGAGKGADETAERCMRVFDEIRRCIGKLIKLTVTIGMGVPVSLLNEIHVSYKSAVQAGNYKILAGGDKVIYIRDIEPADHTEVRFNTEAEQKLNALIKTGCESDVDAVVDALFANVLACRVNEYDVYVIEMALAVLKAANSAGVDTGCVFGEKDKLFKKILDMPNMCGARAEIKHICRKIISELSQMRENTSRKMIWDAMDFVRVHYMDPSVSIESLCAHLHVSQSHFCAIFKKETGDTFNNYLISCRMDEARRLLRGSSMKMVEIAGRVGYTDPNYFSFSFKKVCGVSPREFQNGLEGKKR